MTRLRKFSVFLLVVALLVGMFPISFMFQSTSAEAANANQVVYVGGTNKGTNFGLEISKTVEGTGIENYFDITLKAETTSVKTQDSIDVVVVMDISNSMSSLVTGDNGQVTRLQAVKSSVYEFLNEYSTNSTLAKLTKRFGLVTFNSLAYNVTINDSTNSTTTGMLDIPGNGRAMGIYWEHVDPITYPSSTDVYKSDIWGDLKYDRVRYTNIEGGLQMAQNMLADSTATYKYVVLVTDGFPTTYINSIADPGTIPNFDNRTNINEILGFDCMMENTGWGVDYDKIVDNNGYNTDGAFIELLTNVVCDHGVDYSNKAAIKAREVATAMKDNGINIFTIGVGVDDKTIAKDFNEVLKKNTDGSIYYDENGYPVNTEGYATIDTNGMDEQKVLQGLFEVGNYEDTKAYADWLGSQIGGGTLLANSDVTYLSGNSQSQLRNDIGKILDAIEVAASGRMDSFYVVDPMSKDVEFLGFYDVNGEFIPLATASALVGESKLDAENTASFGATGYDNTIYWDLMTSGFTTETVSEGSTTSTTYTFQIKYRVRLKSDAEGFVWNTAVKTNDTTTLTYESTFYDVDGNETGETREETLEFPIPEVQGYAGTLKFTKVDFDSNAPLANVKFTLTHKGDDCSVCNGDANIDDYTVITDENGEATIENIVSGHKYVLTETAPEGYNGSEAHEVEVAYGKTYIDGALAPDNFDFTITNEKFDGVYVSFVADKTLDGETPDENAFSFKLEGIAQAGTVISETVKNDAEGNIRFSPIYFDEVGEYTFTVEEIAGDEDGIYYDPTVCEITVTISIDNQSKAFVANVSGDTVANDIIGRGDVYVNEFKNSTKQLAQVEFDITKLFKDSQGNDIALEGGEFEFVLMHSDDTIVQTATNDADGKVSFSTLTYNLPAIYIYKIAEVAGDDALIDYDSTIYDITVVVTEGETEYTAEVTITNGDEAVDTISFTNTKKEPTPVDVVLEGTKVLEGRDMEKGEFEFVLADKDGNIIQTILSEATENGNSFEFAFDTLTFDTEGKYEYTVYEKIGEIENVTYDETVYNVVIDVTYNGEGALVAEVTVDGEDYVPFEFVNKYTEPEIPDTPDIPEIPEIPDAGDKAMPYLYVSLMLSIIAIGGFIASKRVKSY